MNKKSVPAYINHGRWLLHCLRCGQALPADERGEGVVCPVCWPGMTAKALRPVPNLGIFRPVPDIEMIGQERARAEAAGEIYTADYPEEKEEIMALLRPREQKNMNWNLGESLDNLRRENAEHGMDIVSGGMPK